jgi:hypothetical protein
MGGFAPRLGVVDGDGDGDGHDLDWGWRPFPRHIWRRLLLLSV